MPNKELEKNEDNKLYFKDGSDPIPWIIQYRRLDSTVWPIRAPEFVRDSGLDINRPKRNRKYGTPAFPIPKGTRHASPPQ